MEINLSKASKASISDLKKPEGLPQIHDNYERPQLEKYEKPEFEKSQKEKPVNEQITPEIKTPDENTNTDNGKKLPIIKTPNVCENIVNKVRFLTEFKWCNHRNVKKLPKH